MHWHGLRRDDTPIGKLMYDFSCTDPDDMNYDNLHGTPVFEKAEALLHNATLLNKMIVTNKFNSLLSSVRSIH